MDGKNNMFRATEKQFSSGWEAFTSLCDVLLLSGVQDL